MGLRTRIMVWTLDLNKLLRSVFRILFDTVGEMEHCFQEVV